MGSEQIPSDLIQRLLTLAEYMERHETGVHGARRPPLGIAWSKLGALAERCHAYAKALHYKELEFDESLTSKELVEGLISINFVMGHTRAAKGILDVHSEGERRSDEAGAMISPDLPGSPLISPDLAPFSVGERRSDEAGAVSLQLSDSPLWHEKLNE